MTEREAKKQVEEDLKNYPYWLIAIETPNLGSPVRWDLVKSKGASTGGSCVEMSAMEEIRRQWKVDVITGVLTKLDSKSKEIIEEWYFRELVNREELEKQIDVDKNKYYYLKNRALRKFMVALGYI
jgi:hypothetical protein